MEAKTKHFKSEKVLPFKEKKEWNLSAKYNIGKKLDDKKESSEEVSDASKPV